MQHCAWQKTGSWDPINGDRGRPLAAIREQMEVVPFETLADGTRWRLIAGEGALWAEHRTPEGATGQSAQYFVCYGARPLALGADVASPLGFGQYPYGWTKSDIDYAVALARHFGASPRDLFAVWYNESGLNPRVINPYGNSGLVQSTGGVWASVVESGSIQQQLDAISALYDSYERTLGESLAARAHRLGTTVAALIHAMMTVPAYVAKITSREQPFLRRGDGNYEGNPCFDHYNKGYTTLADYEDNITAIRDLSIGKAPMIPHCLGLSVQNWAPMGAGARSIFAALPQDSAVGAFFSRVWHSPVGKATLIAAGGAAALTALYYAKYRRLPALR